MPDVYRITVTTKSGETHNGLMTRSQPEVVNGFIAIAKEDTSWISWPRMTYSRWSTCRKQKLKK